MSLNALGQGLELKRTHNLMPHTDFLESLREPGRETKHNIDLLSSASNNVEIATFMRSYFHDDRLGSYCYNRRFQNPGIARIGLTPPPPNPGTLVDFATKSASILSVLSILKLFCTL